MRTNRRQFLGATLAGVGAAAAAERPSAGAAAAITPAGTPADDAAAPLPVVTPDLPTLQPRRIDPDGVKEFHLVAEPVRRDFLPGRPVDCWGFNGTMPGPTIEVTQGDRVRLVVENRLPELFALALARLRDSDCDGRRAGVDAGPDRAGRDVHLRVHPCISTARSSITRTWRCRRCWG